MFVVSDVECMYRTAEYIHKEMKLHASVCIFTAVQCVYVYVFRYLETQKLIECMYIQCVYVYLFRDIELAEYVYNRTELCSSVCIFEKLETQKVCICMHMYVCMYVESMHMYANRQHYCDDLLKAVNAVTRKSRYYDTIVAF